MAIANSNPFNINVVSFVPPYALPSAGQSLAMATVNTFNSIAHPNIGGTGNWNKFGFEQFGSGCMMGDEEYSIICTGGHAHVEYTGEARFNFRTATWSRHDPANGGVMVGPRIADGHTGDPHWDDADTTQDPNWEIIGTNGLGGNFAVPLPPHPYGNLVYLPPSLGGGVNGSALYICRGALGHTGQRYSAAVHKFDRSTLRWERIGTNRGSRCPDTGGAGNEGWAVYDAPRNRFWYIPLAQNNYQTLEYFDLTDLTFKIAPGASDWPPAATGTVKYPWMHNGYLMMAAAGGLLGIDPNNIAAGWQTPPLAGGALPAPYQNAWVYYPRTNAYYWLPNSGGSTLYKLTPPAGNPLTGTWTRSTVTLSQALPAKFGTTEAYRMLAYVPLIDRLAWIATGTQVWLMDPT